MHLFKVVFKQEEQEVKENMKNLPLEVCSKNPLTGFYRDGYCKTGLNDIGVHTVCATMDERFLNFTYKKGNNLYGVAKVGDNWCLCEQRWYEAYKQGIAPHVIHESTNSKTKRHIKDAITTV